MERKSGQGNYRESIYSSILGTTGDSDKRKKREMNEEYFCPWTSYPARPHLVSLDCSFGLLLPFLPSLHHPPAPPDIRRPEPELSLCGPLVVSFEASLAPKELLHVIDVPLSDLFLLC
ncbi:hypothetical protein H1C71_031843 [Ictidomys tridecemlineatus]|nr:hypothetical protein H1C71_031843 [Ictidomys tridecemlineatus]